MDFESAARRLARDQTTRKSNRRPIEVSAKAKKEAEERRKQQAALAAQRERDRRHAEYIEQYFRQHQRNLGETLLQTLSATSIYGEGDKIALPPSVLELLTSDINPSISSSSPWTFRIGLLNPEYSFPTSSQLTSLQPREDDESVHSLEDSEGEEDQEETDLNLAFLDELEHKYLAYTHATVIEFTQEEGHVGLPETVASVLLKQAQRKASKVLSVFRTVDPATATVVDGETSMDLDNDEEKTPGHFAWGAFDLPNMPVEISIVNLPKGKGATLTPTESAIKNGFYNLDDIKLVLEQSLVRTRATLTVGDMVHSWHRGKRFDLKVTAVRPSTYNAVLCLNTDLEIEFGQNEAIQEQMSALVNTKIGDGRRLSEAVKDVSKLDKRTIASTDNQLPAEPPEDAESVCLVQIRSDAIHSRRRFDVNTTTISDLFVFASSIIKEGPFQLVTRYPRRVFTLSDGTLTLSDAGITMKQELLLVERL
jgi:hypothetical protein